MNKSQILDFTDEIVEIGTSLTYAINEYKGENEMKPFIKIYEKLVSEAQKLLDSTEND